MAPLPEPRAFASLSSTLLARKGHAKPAMRPQGFAGFDQQPRAAAASLDDLGWNDMGHDAQPEPVAAPVPAAVVPIAPTVSVPEPAAPIVAEQQAAIAVALETPSAPRDIDLTRAKAGAKAKAAFTLRLESDRHLRLRLACAVTHRSAQSLLTEALDAMLAAIPAVDTLALAARKQNG